MEYKDKIAALRKLEIQEEEDNKKNKFFLLIENLILYSIIIFCFGWLFLLLGSLGRK
tara:strand:+ start:327 stop:497 length:171 start_codon:yes stop_codon:yes gene_type:complete